MCSSLRSAGSHLFSSHQGGTAHPGEEAAGAGAGVGVVRGGGWSGQVDLSGDKRSQSADTTQVPAPGRESSFQRSRAAAGSRACSP